MPLIQEGSGVLAYAIAVSTALSNRRMGTVPNASCRKRMSMTVHYPPAQEIVKQLMCLAPAAVRLVPGDHLAREVLAEAPLLVDARRKHQLAKAAALELADLLDEL